MGGKEISWLNGLQKKIRIDFRRQSNVKLSLRRSLSLVKLNLRTHGKIDVN